jgi:glutamate synthase (NADPH/NADH) large chain
MVALEPVLPADQEKGQPKRSGTSGGERRPTKSSCERALPLHRFGARQGAAGNWATARRKFVKVFPTEYKRALGEMYAKEQAARDGDREAGRLIVAERRRGQAAAPT